MLPPRAVTTVASVFAVSMSLLAAPAMALENVTCSSDPNLFNTGYDAATGGMLPAGSTDANWQAAGPFQKTAPKTATKLPSAATPLGSADPGFVPAFVGNLAPYAWVGALGNAQWISRESAPAGGSLADATSPGGDWYYRYQFMLDPAVDVASFQLALDFYADNSVAEVFVNDQPQSGPNTGLPQTPVTGNARADDPYEYQGYAPGNQSATTLKRDWQTGLNTLLVQTKSEVPYEGFLAKIRPTALCGAAPRVGITKAANATALTRGGSVVYTVTVSNTGSVAANNTVVTDPIPAGVSGFSTTCAASGGAVCPGGAGPQSGPLNETIAALPAGGVVTYTVTATIAADPPDPVVNAAAATPPAGGLCSPGGTAPPCTATKSIPVAARPDLSIGLVGLPASVVAGTAYSGTFTCSNIGSADATAGTSCSVAGLPAGIAVGACTIGPANAPWSAGSAVPAGSAVTCTVSGTPGTAGTSTVTGTTGATQDGNAANNTGTRDITVTTAAASATDVLTSIQPPPSAAAGSTVNVPVTFANVGAATVPINSYRLQLPPGLAGVACAGGGVTCSYDGATGAVTLSGLPGSLASGQNLPFSLRYTAPAAGTPVPVTSTIATAATEANTTNNTATGTTTTLGGGNRPDIVASVAAPTTTTPNGPVSVPVTFGNAGDAIASGVGYALTLPGGLTDVACAAPVNCSYDSGSGAVTVTGLPDVLAAGAAAGLTLRYTAPAAGVVATTAAVSTTTAGETNTANNRAASKTTVVPAASGADVRIALAPPAGSAPGAMVDVPVTVGNAGPSDAAGLSYTLGLPANLAGVTCTGAGVTCGYEPATGVVTVSGLPTTLASGASTPFRLRYTAPATGQVPVNASVAATTSDPNSGNNAASGTTAIAASPGPDPLAADLSTNVSPPATAAAGSVVNVPVGISNVGGSPADGVGVRIALTGAPANVAVMNGSAACTYDAATGAVTGCGLPATLAAGQTINLVVSYTAPASGQVGITSTVGTSSVDANSGNNTASGATTATNPVNAPDLAIGLSGLPGTGMVGTTYDGTFTCTNGGTAAATAATVCSVSGLPAGVTQSACTISPAGATWVAGAPVPAGQTVTCTVSGTPTAAAAAAVTGSTGAAGDSNPSNNSASRNVTIAAAAAVVQPIPTLSQWGMVLLASMAALCGMMRLRRRGAR